MAVRYNAETKTFLLETERSSYIMKVSRYGHLLHLYYGSRVPDEDLDYLLTYCDRGFSPNPYEAGNDRTYSLDFLPQEFSTVRGGDYRSPSVELIWGEGGTAFCGKVDGYEIKKGACAISGMPGLWGIPGERVETLEICLTDPVSRVEARLSYAVFEEKDVIARSVRLVNRGENPVRLERLMSATLDFRNSDYDLIYFTGRHAMEREFRRISVEDGVHSIGSSRGASSHQYNPFAVVCEKDCGEDRGWCWGISLVYSGNFLIEAEKDQYSQLRVNAGINPMGFSFLVDPGREFQAPQAVLAWSDQGFTGLSHIYHRIFRENLCRSPFRNRPRPVLLNSWEAAYFDFDDEKLLDIAREAADLGVELFVLDDGWFGNRDSDSAGLGDWTVNQEKIRIGIQELSREIHRMGMQFGIWVEPERGHEWTFEDGPDRVCEMGYEPEPCGSLVCPSWGKAPGRGAAPVCAGAVLRDGSGDSEKSGDPVLRVQRRRRPVRSGDALLPAADLVQRQYGRGQPAENSVWNLVRLSVKQPGGPRIRLPQPHYGQKRAFEDERDCGDGRRVWL